MQQQSQDFLIPTLKLKNFPYCTLYYSYVTERAVDEPGNRGWSETGINLYVAEIESLEVNIPACYWSYGSVCFVPSRPAAFFP